MKSPHRSPLLNWLPQLSYQVWIIALGRLLSQLGSGFTLFYASIFFVNQVGLSATAVGIGLGSASVSGMLGRVIGGSMADSPRWGRKPTMLLSAVVSAIASVILALTYNLPVFVLGNLLMGLGVGLYWPATEALVADSTETSQRNEAYALTRLADSLGLGLGVVLGGAWISATGAYRGLFVIDGLSFLIFFAIVWASIKEVRQATEQPPMLQTWSEALSDRALLIYCVVNVLFTFYLVQIVSTLPLYFSNFVTGTASGKGFAPGLISALFTWHLVMSVFLQMPIARRLNQLRRPQALTLSALLWGLGFICVGFCGVAKTGALGWAIAGLTILGLATITYMPAASSLVVELAPESLRGVYLSVNSQCWALGYLLGPPLGGYALDQPRPIPDYFWVGLSLSVGVAILVLRYLDRQMQRPATNSMP